MLTQLARETLLTPRQLLARVLALPLSSGERWQVYVAVVFVSTLVSTLFLMALDRDGSLAPIMPAPLTLAIANGLLLLGVAVAVHAIGRGFGGTGRFGGALLAMSLLQTVMVAAQVVQMLLLFVSVPLAEVVGFAALGLMMWLLANFIMELHGFRSLVRVALGVIAAVLALSLLFSFILIAGMTGPGV